MAVASLFFAVIAALLFATPSSSSSSSPSSSSSLSLFLLYHYQHYDHGQLLRDIGLVLIGALFSFIVTIKFIAVSSSSSSSVQSVSDDNNKQTISLSLSLSSSDEKTKQEPENEQKQCQQQKERDQDQEDTPTNDNDKKNATHSSSTILRSVEELRTLLPAGGSGSSLETAKKVLTHELDEQMVEFIQRSPFLQLATVDSHGQPCISPKGDTPGFVSIIRVTAKEKKHEHRNEINNNNKVRTTMTTTEATTTASRTTTTTTSLVIPDRPGNRLLFSLQNIVEGNTKVSLLFEIPGTKTTLRIYGRNARVSTELPLLQRHIARRCQPKVVIIVDIQYAFFHCAKAYMRSGLWDNVVNDNKTKNDNTTVTTATSIQYTQQQQQQQQQQEFVEGQEEESGNNMKVMNRSGAATAEFTVGFGRYYAPKDSFLATVIDNDIRDHYIGVQQAIDGKGKEVER